MWPDIITPVTSLKEFKDRLDFVSSKVLKALEPVGKAVTSTLAGLSQGNSSVVLPAPTKKLADKKLQVQKETERQVEKAMPYLSPTNHVVAWTQGSLDPNVGAQKIAQWGPTAQLAGLGTDVLAFKYVPKAVKSTAATAVNTAAKAGNKTARAAVISKELNKASNQGVQNPEAKSYVPKMVLSEAERLGIPKGERNNVIKSPIRYDKEGNLYTDKNYFYRRGWGIIDDAQKTGVIRVPEGDYKPAVLKKYPFLNDGFSTMMISHKFPYFSEGKLWPNKYGTVPDLIAVSNNEGTWVGGSKFGSLLEDTKPSEVGGRGTPLINGETNKFPTSKSILYRLNTATGKYEPIIGKTKILKNPDSNWNLWEPDYSKYLQGIFDKVFKKETPGLQTITQDKPKTSLAFFENKPSKISNAERQGIPKGERNFNPRWHVAKYPGYQLKILMGGSPLEKALSKNGTINVNVLKSFLNSASKVEKEVINKVLNYNFPGQKNIDYNKLKLTSKFNLINYDKIPNARYSHYGLDRIGYQVNKEPDGAGWYVEHSGFPVETFTFESSSIPQGSGKHYSQNTLGHIRTFTTNEEPKVLQVLENQSDWGQKALNSESLLGYLDDSVEKQHLINFFNRYLRHVPHDYLPEYLKFLKDIKKYPDGFPQDVSNLYTEKFKDYIDNSVYEKYQGPSRNAIIRYNKYIGKINGYPEQINYLHNNYLQKQLQEILKFASEKGQTKMRYPTPETAAKIEGYKKVKVQNPKANALSEQLDEMWRIYRDDNIEYVNQLHPSDWEKVAIREIPGYNETLNELKAISNTYDYIPEHKTILKKYSDFPKLFQKLYKGQEVRTITDAKGNTWYEVDVPKNYLNSEWQFKNGGMIKKFQEPDSPIYGGMLPETVVTPYSESNYSPNNYIDELQEERQRQRNIAKNYFSEAPTVNNVISGLTAFLNSVPGIGLSTSDVMGKYAPITGIAPAEGPANKIRKTSKLVSKAEDVVNETSNTAKKAVDGVTELVKRRRGRPPLSPEEKARRAKERAEKVKKYQQIKKENAIEDEKLRNRWRGKRGNKDFNQKVALEDGDMRHLNSGKTYTTSKLNKAREYLNEGGAYSNSPYAKKYRRTLLRQAEARESGNVDKLKHWRQEEKNWLIEFLNNFNNGIIK